MKQRRHYLRWYYFCNALFCKFLIYNKYKVDYYNGHHIKVVYIFLFIAAFIKYISLFISWIYYIFSMWILNIWSDKDI